MASRSIALLYFAAAFLFTCSRDVILDFGDFCAGAGLVSFLLDPPALVLIGFGAGKAYYLLVAFGDRVIRRGALRKNLITAGSAVVLVFWAYSGLLYTNAVYFPCPLPRWFGGTDWMLNSGLPLGLARSTVADAFAKIIFATYPTRRGDEAGNLLLHQESSRTAVEVRLAANGLSGPQGIRARSD